ncbi:MAG: hypothetical protein LUH36_04715, partial [Oscillospiraceae bacterium]|nr:hypothetical protein [Oscillospiraceae bacterium]
YVSDATLTVGNTNGIVISSTDNLLYEDSLSHIEATNVYTTGDGALDFIVMGGTLTYNFNHENNVWPYNATDIEIGVFATDAFGVNAIAPVRSIDYTKDEALVNFIVPSDEEHLTFDAVYQTLTNTYSYQSDAAKEGDTLSIWVPGVEVYYNFDEDTDLVNTNLTRKYVDDLEGQGVDFVPQYTDVTEPYGYGHSRPEH